MNIKQKLASVLIGVTALTGIGMANASAASALTLERCWVDTYYVQNYSYKQKIQRQQCYFNYTAAEEKAGKRDGTFERYYDYRLFKWSSWKRVY